MATELQTTVTFHISDCPTCHCKYAIDEYLYRQAKAYGNTVYCPNGHRWSYSKPEIATLREQAARATARADQAVADAKYQRERLEQEQKSHAATKGQVTKIKNRVKNGVCPCCNRSFTDLRRHMTVKHPNFVTPTP